MLPRISNAETRPFLVKERKNHDTKSSKSKAKKEEPEQQLRSESNERRCASFCNHRLQQAFRALNELGCFTTHTQRLIIIASLVLLSALPTASLDPSFTLAAAVASVACGSYRQSCSGLRSGPFPRCSARRSSTRFGLTPAPYNETAARKTRNIRILCDIPYRIVPAY